MTKKEMTGYCNIVHHHHGNLRSRHLVWLNRLSLPRATAILSRKLSTLSRASLSLPVLFILRILDAIISEVSEEITLELATELFDVFRSTELLTVGLFNRLLL